MKSILITILAFFFLGVTTPFKNAERIVKTNSDSINIRVSIYDKLSYKKDYLLILDHVANNIGTNNKYLYLIIQHESGFKTTATNPHTNAVGLIQFMPSTLKGMGYTVNEVYNMSLQEQLIVVEEYYKPYSNYNLDHPVKLFLCTFYPYGLKVWNNDSYIFGSEGYRNPYTIAKQNKGFDLNKDGQITMKEYKDYHYKYIINQN